MPDDRKRRQQGHAPDGALGSARGPATAAAPGKRTRAELAAYDAPVVSQSATPSGSEAARAHAEAWGASSFIAAMGYEAPQELDARARALLAQLGPQSSLVGAYHLAVASQDPAAVRELAGQVVAAVREAQALRERWPEPSGGAPFAPELEAAVASLAVQLSPQLFGGTLVVATLSPPPRAHVVHRGWRMVASEAARVVDLLESARRITALVAPQGDAESRPASEAALQEAISEFERFTSRPIEAEFLARALTVRGVWLEIAQARTKTPNAGQHLQRAQKQGAAIGMTADAGPKWNEENAQEALSYSALDWAVSEPEAMRVIEMLGAADPQARAGLVKQLHQQGRLHRLADNVGWAYIKQIAESLNDAEAEALLLPYWQGRGETPSLGQMLNGAAADQRKQGGLWGRAKAFGLETLDSGLNLMTFGGKQSADAAHEAMNEGWISADTAGTQASKGIGRAALIGAATFATGGAAGAWAEGAALAAGAGRAGAAIVGATAGGAVGNTGGHLAGDAFDQSFSGKQGFDSFDAYGRTFAEGGLWGAAMAPLGLAAARYLPEGMRTMAQQIAARHPELVTLLEASQRAGISATFRVRLTVREWLRMLEGDGGPTAGGGMAPAFAFASGVSPRALASLPPDTEVLVTGRARVDQAALQSRLDDEGPFFDIDQIEALAKVSGKGSRASRSGSLFDDHDLDTDYADHPHDYRSDQEQISRPTEVDHDRSEVLGAHGTSVMHANRLGIHRPPRHHLLPQEHIEFFQARGFPGRDIDAFCIEMTNLEHSMIHARHRNWTEELISTLTLLERAMPRPLSRAQILDVMKRQMRAYGFANREIISYVD